MPEYEYKDENNHHQTVRHPMMFDGAVHCTICQEMMWRVPQPVVVTWGGLPPSANIDRPPEIQDMIANETKNREDYLKRKEGRNE